MSSRLPRHVDPPEHLAATAPYNFVPLPEQIMSTDGLYADTPPWKCFNRYVEGLHSGWIDLDIRALTPIFIRGAQRPNDEGIWPGVDDRLWSNYAATVDGRPKLPGSSVRGMVRNLVEILGFCGIGPVSSAKPFYRTVGKDRVGIAYRNRMTKAGNKPEGGFLARRDGRWVVKASAGVLRVEHQLLAPLGLHYRFHPTYRPSIELQHRSCWVRRDPKRRYRVAEIHLNEPETDATSFERGRLVLSGGAPKKKAEFVLLEPHEAGEEVAVPSAVWERFHDDDQITKYQQESFPKRETAGTQRRGPGALVEGEPVFFIRDREQKVLFLGRAQMFRLPYDLSPASLTPDARRSGGIDLATAMFGTVEGEHGAIRSRLAFEDAVAVGAPPEEGWSLDEFVPQILSGPKPTATQHYLTQNGEEESTALTTYLSGDHTTIRGHKLYWHRPPLPPAKVTPAEVRRDPAAHSQRTIISPVRHGVQFRGKIRFTNLTDLELGLLLSALKLPAGSAHKIGMGKSLGLGSIQTSATPTIVNARRRYSAWAASGATAESGNIAEQCVAEFESGVLAHAQETGEPLCEGAGLATIDRLNDLFLMLSWQDRPNPDRIMAMDLDRFKAKRVLPTPSGVVGREHSDVPREVRPWPGPPETDAGARSPRHVRHQRHDDSGTRPPNKKQTAQTSRRRVIGTAMAEKTKKGGWRFDLTGGSAGVLHPASDSPPTIEVGDSFEFEVVSGGQQNAQLRWVPPTDADPKAG